MQPQRHCPRSWQESAQIQVHVLRGSGREHTYWGSISCQSELADPLRILTYALA